MAGLIVKAECAMVRVGERFVTLLKHAVVPEGADADHVQMLKDRGIVVEGDGASGLAVPDRAAPFTVAKQDAPAATGDDPDGDGPMPAKSASRADWDTFAKSEAGGSLTDEDLKALSTKEDLQAHYGVQ